VEIFDNFRAASRPPAAIEVKFCTAKRTHVPIGHTKFDVNLFNESPLRAKNLIFWPVSNFNTDSLPLRGILPVKILSRPRPRPSLVFKTQHLKTKTFL